MPTQLDDQILAIQTKLSLIEAYRKLAEWLNAAIPADKNLNKFITNTDTLVTVALELSQFARTKAEALANSVDVTVHAFEADEIALFKQMVQAFKSKISPN